MQSYLAKNHHFIVKTEFGRSKLVKKIYIGQIHHFIVKTFFNGKN
jgi:hypothetical protein